MVERAIKQALHLLNHLQNVWQDVLPISVYRKAIGKIVQQLSTLVSYFCVTYIFLNCELDGVVAMDKGKLC